MHSRCETFFRLCSFAGAEKGFAHGFECTYFRASAPDTNTSPFGTCKAGAEREKRRRATLFLRSRPLRRMDALLHPLGIAVAANAFLGFGMLLAHAFLL